MTQSLLLRPLISQWYCFAPLIDMRIFMLQRCVDKRSHYRPAWLRRLGEMSACSCRTTAESYCWCIIGFSKSSYFWNDKHVCIGATFSLRWHSLVLRITDSQTAVNGPTLAPYISLVLMYIGHPILTSHANLRGSEQHYYFPPTNLIFLFTRLLLSAHTLLIKSWMQQVEAYSVGIVKSPSGRPEEIINRRRSRKNEATTAE